MRLYSVYYISVGSSTCFGCWHPSSGARTTVITASGTGQLGLLPSALIVELEPTQQQEPVQSFLSHFEGACIRYTVLVAYVHTEVMT